ncbi:carboxymuconolactone decarboxylase family protein [Thermovenabulum sp.]|uniref:carboxymuconolactone decarboxylase family protein n=1 Tax=Thermovenabulum sp. TaxID=3100335 RepID=UPI003C7DC5F6
MSRNYPPFISVLEQKDPKLFEIVSKNFDLAMGPGELEPKVKVLIALALDAFANSPEGVESLSKTARQMGATEGEIAETLRIAYMVSGMKTLSTLSNAFK